MAAPAVEHGSRPTPAQPFDLRLDSEERELPPVIAAATSSTLLQQSPQDGGIALQLPGGFSFYTPGFVDFDHVIQHFDWDLRERSLTIDLSSCTKSNFQALALLIQYAWYLTLNGCVARPNKRNQGRAHLLVCRQDRPRALPGN
jgi:hypothetical protein